MRAIVQSRYGRPADVLRLADVPRPAIAADEVLVRVHAAAVHADVWHSVSGLPYTFRLMTGWRAPSGPVPGTDLAGVVEAVGSRVTCFTPGDQVFGATTRGFPVGNGGAFAELAAAPEQSLVLKPANVTFEQAASVPASGYIAWANLIPAGSDLHRRRALVNGAGGGVGTLALQLLKARGAHVTAVDAGPKLAMLQSLGADETIDYTRDNVLDQGGRYDLILDIASNLPLKACRRVLTPSGLFLWIGHEHYGRGGGSRLFGSGIPTMMGLMARSLFRDPNLPKVQFPIAIPKLQDALAAMRDLMADGRLVPPIEPFPLESVADAFRRLEEGTVFGKVVLTVGQPQPEVRAP
jgi:NADPH:quinone reductase-like Zn-dependent oxidoreductase